MNNNRKEKVQDYIKWKKYVPLTLEEMAAVLDVPKNEIDLLKEILDELLNKKIIRITKTKRYCAIEVKNTGVLMGVKSGACFFKPDDKSLIDFFIPRDMLNGAMSGDSVVVEKLKDTVDRGKVTEIIKANRDNIIAFVAFKDKRNFVVPLNKSIPNIFIKGKFNANINDIVLVNITKAASGFMSADGELVKIIGNIYDATSYIKALCFNYKLEMNYPKFNMPKVDNDSKQRRNLKKDTIITIDGADAKDLDDAVSVTKKENGNYILGVHIADVSHYIKTGSELDKEALKRSNSTYLVDTVIPMLPKEISNGLCSLNPNEEKLTFSITMEVNPDGKVVDHEIYKSLISTTERMTYTDVFNIIENNDEELVKKYSHIYDDLLLMKELALILRRKRKERGSIDFNFKESKIVVNENRVPIKIAPYELTLANNIIEEFMLVANQSVAEYLKWFNVPFPYRIHEKPKIEKLKALNQYIGGFGYKINKIYEVHPKTVQQLIEDAKGKPEEHLINVMTLRSMNKAVYSTNNVGHFGLGMDNYCHFTSPIRRYADLVVHRILKMSLVGDMDEQFLSGVEGICDLISENERNSQLIERDLTDYYKTLFMEDKIDEEFNGIVSGIHSFGIFIELENTVQGLVRLSEMEGNYEFDDENNVVVDQFSKKSYSIGNKVTIIVKKVDIFKKEIDFAIK